MNNLKCEIMTELTGGSPAEEKSGRPYNNTWSRQDFGGSDSPTCSQFTTLIYIFPTVNLSRVRVWPFLPPSGVIKGMASCSLLTLGGRKFDSQAFLPAGARLLQVLLLLPQPKSIQIMHTVKAECSVGIMSTRMHI